MVRALTSSFVGAPEEVRRAGWSRECEAGITAGKEYTVYAITFFGTPEYGRPRLINFQIVDDWDVIAWLPCFLFEVVDRHLPVDWECNLFRSGTMVIGPRFMSESEESYIAMVELEPGAVQQFRDRERTG